MTNSLYGKPALCKVEFTDCGPEKNALGLCQKYVDTLKNENQVLRQLNDKLKEQRDEATSKLDASTPPLLPWWGWALIGAGVGIGTYGLIRR